MSDLMNSFQYKKQAPDIASVGGRSLHRANNPERLIQAFIKDTHSGSTDTLTARQKTALETSSPKEILELVELLVTRSKETRDPLLKKHYADSISKLFFGEALLKNERVKPEGLSYTLIKQPVILPVWKAKVTCQVMVNSTYGIPLSTENAAKASVSELFLEPGKNTISVQVFRKGKIVIGIQWNVLGSGIKKVIDGCSVTCDDRTKDYPEENIRYWIRAIQAQGLTGTALRLVKNANTASSTYRPPFTHHSRPQGDIITINMNEPVPEISFRHELAHAFYFKTLERTELATMKAIFKKIAAGEPHTSLSVYDALRTQEGGADKTNTELFKVFDESEYCRVLQRGFGHPNDDPTELFASTSTIAQLYPEHLIQNIDNITDENKKKLAMEILCAVLQPYLRHLGPKQTLFDQKIIDFVRKHKTP